MGHSALALVCKMLPSCEMIHRSLPQLCALFHTVGPLIVFVHHLLVDQWEVERGPLPGQSRVSEVH